GSERFIRRQFPKPCSSVSTRGKYALTIGAVGCVIDSVAVNHRCCDGHCFSHIPNTGHVSTCREDIPPVWAEEREMPPKPQAVLQGWSDWRAGNCFPDACRVRTGRGDFVTRSAE